VSSTERSVLEDGKLGNGPHRQYTIRRVDDDRFVDPTSHTRYMHLARQGNIPALARPYNMQRVKHTAYAPGRLVLRTAMTPPVWRGAFSAKQANVPHSKLAQDLRNGHLLRFAVAWHRQLSLGSTAVVPKQVWSSTLMCKPV
jgi:hypothetical protein